MDTQDRYIVEPEDAPRIAHWIAERGGLSIWESENLSNPGASWTTPRLTEDGHPTTRPTWQAGVSPARVVLDVSEVVVEEAIEVRRFHVAVRCASGGLSLKLTDASSRKVRAAVERTASRRADRRAWYHFDYHAQEAVIYVAGAREPLADWLQRHQATGGV